MAHVSHDSITVDLRPIEHGVVSALNGDSFAAVYRGFSPVGAVAFVSAAGGIHVREYVDTGPFTCTNTHADTTAAAAALSAGLLGAGGAAENDIVLRVQQRVSASLQLTSGNYDVAAVRASAFSVRSNGEIVSRVQRAARYHIALIVLLRFGFLRGQREADPHGVRISGGCRHVSCLPSLHAGQHRFGGLQCFETAVAFLVRVLRCGNSIINRAADRAGQRHRQPAFLLFKGFIAGALVVPRLNDDAVTAEA